jgi:DNA (cytosine-5)-methyltransferase 1
MKKGMTYIDLFSGSGGFSLGFDNKGFQNIFSIDIEPSFCETYKYNFPNHTLIEKDICQLSDEEIKEQFRQVRQQIKDYCRQFIADNL